MSNHIKDLLSAYMDEELTEKERQQAEEHLNSCPECALLLRELMDIKSQVFTTFHSVEAPKTLENTVIHALSSAASSNISRLRYWLLVPLLCPPLVFAIAFALMGSFVFKVVSIGFKVTGNLIYAIGTIVSSYPYTISGLILISLLLIIGSSVSIRLLLKTRAI